MLMFRIVEKRTLADNIYLLRIEAPRVAHSALPGQFVIVRMDEEGERIPLTICDYDREKGTVTIVFQCVGAGTQMMCHLNEGDFFHDFVGPLGCASELVHEEIAELKEKIMMIPIQVIAFIYLIHLHHIICQKMVLYGYLV